MGIGPVEILEFVFPGNQFTGEIAPALGELVESGLIRVIDLVFVTKDGPGFGDTLRYRMPSPISYATPKPEEVTEVDRIVEKWPLHLRPDDIKIVPVEDVFANGAEIDTSRSPRGR